MRVTAVGALDSSVVADVLVDSVICAAAGVPASKWSFDVDADCGTTCEEAAVDAEVNARLRFFVMKDRWCG